MGTTHDNYITTKIAELRNDGWIAQPNVFYKSFIFDIFAVEPSTHKMKVIEVVFSNRGSLTPKETFCKEHQIEFEAIHIVQRKKIIGRYAKISSVFNAVSDSMRLTILEYAEPEPTTYSKILFSLGLDPSGDAGKFVYHLKTLLSGKLMKKSNGMYEITNLGKEVLNFCRHLSEPTFM